MVDFSIVFGMFIFFGCIFAIFLRCFCTFCWAIESSPLDASLRCRRSFRRNVEGWFHNLRQGEKRLEAVGSVFCWKGLEGSVGGV